MFPKNLMRDLIVSVAVVAFLFGMGLTVVIPKAWALVKPIIHEATAEKGEGR